MISNTATTTAQTMSTSTMKQCAEIESLHAAFLEHSSTLPRAMGDRQDARNMLSSLVARALAMLPPSFSLSSTDAAQPELEKRTCL